MLHHQRPRSPQVRRQRLQTMRAGQTLSSCRGIIHEVDLLTALLCRRELLHRVVRSVTRTGTSAPLVCPSWTQTSSAPPRRTTLHLHRHRRTCSRHHLQWCLVRLVLTVLQMHSRTQRDTYHDGLGGEGGKEQETASTGTGGIDTVCI